MLISDKTILRYGSSFEIFDHDPDDQRSVSFCILQIGELSGGLSQEYRQATAERVQWGPIKGMRNLAARNYGSMSRDIQLRALCLGQSVRLTSILPSHVQAQPIEHQARQLSEQILFALAKMHEGEISPHQLSCSQNWLYGVSLYLLQECREEDQTFQEFKRLVNLPQHIRSVLFENFLSAPKALTEKEPPALLQNLDAPSGIY